MDDEAKKRKKMAFELIKKAWKDKSFRQELLANPRSAIEQLTSYKIPDDVEILIHEQKPKLLHLVVPERPENVEEMSDDDISQKAGAYLEALGSAFLFPFGR
ncbi:MAG: NHLP leader peptide family RiPP precursor [Gemmataceae bacterium]